MQITFLPIMQSRVDQYYLFLFTILKISLIFHLKKKQQKANKEQLKVIQKNHVNN
jgi:hypothetical protein